jgi:hypothetical protein
LPADYVDFTENTIFNFIEKRAFRAYPRDAGVIHIIREIRVLELLNREVL